MSNQVPALIAQRLSHEAFQQLSGVMAGYPFVKIVVDKNEDKIHFLNNNIYSFHAEYIAENILGQTKQELHDNVDAFNKSIYLSPQPDRRFYLGIVACHNRENDHFYTLETVEIDNMDSPMLQFFFTNVKSNLDASFPLFFKPANHLQEKYISEIDPGDIPRIFNHELFASAPFVALNPGKTKGRLRIFKDEEDYRQQFTTIYWYDIIVMDRVPDDIPRVSGIINSQHTTPLSHTNVLACGWEIPNATEVDIIKELEEQGLNGSWVEYSVTMDASKVNLEKIDEQEKPEKPIWQVQRITIEEPEISPTPIKDIEKLRISDASRYGTKAVHLGELCHLLKNFNKRLIGYYRTPRPPRKDLKSYLAAYLNMSEDGELAKGAWEFLRSSIVIPKGIALPFSLQQEFLETASTIQQTIGKLKMALELNAKQSDAICIRLQQMMCKRKFTDDLHDHIDSEIADALGGVSSFVVRSSSNAEDLEDFSAAGIYESFNHVTTAGKIFDSIKNVWSSLVSPRSVRLRQQVGISLDDCYMGVIVQEEITAQMGGVMVTMNPMAPKDFRNIYINVSTKSAQEVVEGKQLPYQYLFNTLEGGGRTLSIGNAKEDLDENKKQMLQKLAFVGRFLQSYFSKDYTFSSPLDIEWAIDQEKIYILQLRPYAR